MIEHESLPALLEALRLRGWRGLTREDRLLAYHICGLKPWDATPSWAHCDEPPEEWAQFPEKAASWARARALRLELSALAGVEP